MQRPTGPTWPPPSPSTMEPSRASPTAPRTPAGWYQAADGLWYETDVPPAPGWWLASDLRWYPPSQATWHPDQMSWGAAFGSEGWRGSRWGLGDVWWGGLVFVLASVGISILLVLTITLLDPDTAFADVELGPYAVSVSVLANVLAFAGVPWSATRRKGLRSLAADFGLTFRWGDVAIGFGLGLAALIGAGMAAAAVDELLGNDEQTSNIPIDDLTGPVQFVVFFVAVAVVTPIIEELFFRGLLHRSLLKRGLGRPGAMVVTTLVFVIPHLLAAPSWPEIAALFTAITVIGAMLHLACLLTGLRLAAPIMAHIVVNGTAVIALAAG